VKNRKNVPKCQLLVRLIVGFATTDDTGSDEIFQALPPVERPRPIAIESHLERTSCRASSFSSLAASRHGDGVYVADARRDIVARAREELGPRVLHRPVSMGRSRHVPGRGFPPTASPRET